MARSFWLSLVALAAGTGLLVAAVGDVSAGAADGARRGGTLRLGLPVVDIDVDPAIAYTNRSWALEFATCAKLFTYPDAAGSAGTRVIPEVAKGFPRISRDGRTYTFELRRTFRFHTGARVTARSFADAFTRDATPRMDSPAVAYMHEIVGADAVINGAARTISGIRVLGPYRLRIRLKRPVADFIARLTMPFFCPVLPNTPVKRGGIDNPPGSGPYYIAERIPNRRIVLRRNRFYRGGRPANVDQMVFTVEETADSCQLATEQDRIDLCLVNRALPDATWRRIVQRYGVNRPGGRFFFTPALGTWYFAFNHDRPAFRGRGQIALKKAINYAIDRPALVRALGYLGGRRTDQMLPPALGRSASLYPLRGADPATARRWLARARFKPTKLVLYTWNIRVGIEFGQVFAFNLRQIGIDVDVKHFEQVALLERAARRGEPYDVAFNGLGADYADGAGLFEPLLSGRALRQPGHSNLSYFDDARTNARMDAAGRLTGEARRRAWAELDVDLMRTNPPWAPFLHPTARDFLSRSFGCYLRNPINGVDLAAACKK